MHDLTTLPVSSVPAAFDREHLYSPSAGTAELIDHRPGDAFGPLPQSPRGNPAAWKEWWITHASASTADYLGLKAGDQITIQHASSTGPGTVLSTCRFGAIVQCPMPQGSEKPHSEMYVTARNQFGHWYR